MCEKKGKNDLEGGHTIVPQTITVQTWNVAFPHPHTHTRGPVYTWALYCSMGARRRRRRRRRRKKHISFLLIDHLRQFFQFSFQLTDRRRLSSALCKASRGHVVLVGRSSVDQNAPPLAVVQQYFKNRTTTTTTRGTSNFVPR